MSDVAIRPKVTFALFAYNQERFVGEAVKAALAQDYSPLEIIISDDCSSDATFEQIKLSVSGYKGPNKIILNRNSVNLGLAQHFNEILARSEGDIIVVAAGDDISLPGRVSTTVRLLGEDPKATFVSFAHEIIDAAGNGVSPANKENKNDVLKFELPDYLEGTTPLMSGASRGFRRELFDVFGNLRRACPTEDTPYLMRGLMLGHGLLSKQIGIRYRVHENNLSGSQSMPFLPFDEIKKQYLHDVEMAFKSQLIDTHLMAKLLTWVDQNYRRRLLSSEFSRSSRRFRFFMRHIALTSDFRAKEKVGLFRQIFRSSGSN